MTYQETCDYLFRQTPSFEKTGKTGFNEGLAITLALDEHTGHPHRQFRSIHVAGTNGKGSVSHTLASHLQRAGYRVGLYTSPHLVDFRERIRVGGEMIPEQYVVDFVDDFLKWNEASRLSPLTSHFPLPASPSFFELTTAMAFRYFADQHVDIAVVEVGLGGRLDCTNIITPLLSIITNISLDHTDMLGDTLALIAREKAGIIKPGVPVVIGEDVAETRPVFEQVARQQEAPIIFASDAPIISSAMPLPDGGMRYTTTDGTTFDGELSGLYQARNTNTVLHALRLLQQQGIIGSIDYEAFMTVGKTTGLMGRWQKLQERPAVVCDTGHNVGGWEYLSRQLGAVSCREMHIVFGMVSDKDASTVISMLPKTAYYYFTKAQTKRAIPEAELLRIAQANGLSGQAYPSVYEAYQAAMQQAADDDFVFIGGSTYVVADLMKSII
ncbi:MAG: bifunctional folylpolyglutamate synthase/dihydrofolate synthase [Prevotella sp.]|nr:bifunctional folylpolyglutamate synthase/dihydrofolate synthase [Prevotella sp.]